jgi:hypothetical protein
MFFLSLFFYLNAAQGANWPVKSDDTWIGEKPTSSTLVDVVVFGSAQDLYFLEILDVLKNLDKKYKPLGARFLGVARKESKFPFDEKVVEDSLRERGNTVPIYLDYNSSFSKKWHAYVSPTVTVVLKNDKTINFDSVNFDPVQLEKTIQKALKDEGVNNLPTKEYTNDAEYKNCPLGVTFLLGKTQHNAWDGNLTKFDDNWKTGPHFVEKESHVDEAKFEISLRDSALGIIAESDSAAP